MTLGELKIAFRGGGIWSVSYRKGRTSPRGARREGRGPSRAQWDHHVCGLNTRAEVGKMSIWAGELSISCWGTATEETRVERGGPVAAA